MPFNSPESDFTYICAIFLGITPEYPAYPTVLGLGFGLGLGSQLGLGLV